MNKVVKILIFLILIPGNVFSEFKVGMSVPLTGDLAEFGVAIKNGTLLAKKDYDLSQVKFIWDDNMYKTHVAVNSFQKLSKINKVNLLYSWGESPLYAIADLAERNKIPLVAMSYDEEKAIDKKYIINTINPTDDFVSALLDYFRKHQIKKIALINTEDIFFNSFIKSFAKLIKDEEIKIISSVLESENNFRPIFSKLKQANFDILGVLLFSGQISTFYRQLKTQGLNLFTFGVDNFDSQEEVKNSHGAMEGAIYPIIKVPDEFQKKYTQSFNNTTHLVFAYNTYIFCKLMADLVNNYQAENLSSLEIIQAIKSEAKKLSVAKLKESRSTYISFPIVLKTVQ